MRRFIALLVAFGTTAGCARAPEAVQAGTVADNAYAPFACPVLLSELARVQAVKADLYRQQRNRRTDDVAMFIIVGVTPTALGGGKAVEAGISDAKARENGLNAEIARKNCRAEQPSD